MKSDELKEIITDISKFEYVSCREQESSNKLEKMLNRKVETVLDPTLLLYKEEWKKLLHNWRNTYTNEKYIFYYVLKGTRSLNKDLKIICNMAKTRGYKVVTASPLSVVLPNKNIINAIDASVFDFLGLIRDAQYVITDSYHGTLFSINFNKNMYSLQKKPGDNKRVEQIAQELGFTERVIYSLEDINFDSIIDYSIINFNRNNQRKKSIDYLKNAIEN